MADKKMYKVGITVKEPWSADISYEVLDITLYAVENGGDGCSYIAIRANQGVTPGTDDTVWVKATQRGQSIYDLAVKYGDFEGTEAEFEAEYEAALHAAQSAAQSASDIEAQVETNEAARVTAERARSDAETARSSAETARINAENARNDAESLRDTAESDRVRAEAGRVTAEASRVEAETFRQGAEQSRRQQFEGLKADMETAIGNVDAKSAEIAEDIEGYEANEAGRVSAENARAAAESARVSAESSRVSAESARATAETARVAQAASDHTRAETDHTRAESDHTRAEEAAAAAEHMVDIKQGPQGPQGNTGSSVDYPYELVNNLTTDDATKGLSAAQGVVLDGKVSQLGQKVDGLDVNVGTWSVGSVNNPSGGHIPDISSNRRMRTAELIIPLTATYFFKVNSGYKFGLIVVGKRETLIWDSTLSIDLQQGDVYRIILREDPDPTNANIYSGWTQEQIDALIASSGFDMFVKSSFDELKEELEDEINAVAITAIKSEQYCEIDVPVWPHPISYIQDGLIFFLDCKDFTSGTWIDKVGNSSFAMNNCVKDGDGVKFDGSTSYGTTEDNLSFPSQAYTIEMVVKGEKEVSASSDSQIIFNTKNSGDFSLGFGMAGGRKQYTFQAGTVNPNLGYLYTTALGIKRLSVNKDRCVVNGESLASGIGVGIWGVGAKVVVGANASNTNWYFKGTIYAIRIYNRLLSENEMKANQMFDLDYYNL